MVAKEGTYGKAMSLSSWRAWIEIVPFACDSKKLPVALLMESVD